MEYLSLTVSTLSWPCQKPGNRGPPSPSLLFRLRVFLSNRGPLPLTFTPIPCVFPLSHPTDRLQSEPAADIREPHTCRRLAIFYLLSAPQVTHIARSCLLRGRDLTPLFLSF